MSTCISCPHCAFEREAKQHKDDVRTWDKYYGCQFVSFGPAISIAIEGYGEKAKQIQFIADNVNNAIGAVVYGVVAMLERYFIPNAATPEEKAERVDAKERLLYGRTNLTVEHLAELFEKYRYFANAEEQIGYKLLVSGVQLKFHPREERFQQYEYTNKLREQQKEQLRKEREQKRAK